ncbi:MAG: hypothetical protein ABR562_06005, partial [Thermoplasmatota archaeon]
MCVAGLGHWAAAAGNLRQAARQAAYGGVNMFTPAIQKIQPNRRVQLCDHALLRGRGHGKQRSGGREDCEGIACAHDIYLYVRRQAGVPPQ